MVTNFVIMLCVDSWPGLAQAALFCHLGYEELSHGHLEFALRLVISSGSSMHQTYICHSHKPALCGIASRGGTPERHCIAAQQAAVQVCCMLLCSYKVSHCAVIVS